jgi:hypothetical protein
MFRSRCTDWCASRANSSFVCICIASCRTRSAKSAEVSTNRIMNGRLLPDSGRAPGRYHRYRPRTCPQQREPDGTRTHGRACGSQGTGPPPYGQELRWIPCSCGKAPSIPRTAPVEYRGAVGAACRLFAGMPSGAAFRRVLPGPPFPQSHSGQASLWVHKLLQKATGSGFPSRSGQGFVGSLGGSSSVGRTWSGNVTDCAACASFFFGFETDRGFASSGTASGVTGSARPVGVSPIGPDCGIGKVSAAETLPSFETRHCAQVPGRPLPRRARAGSLIPTWWSACSCGCPIEGRGRSALAAHRKTARADQGSGSRPRGHDIRKKHLEGKQIVQATSDVLS